MTRQDKRQRVTIQFQLDLNNADDAAMVEHIKYLKGRGEFTQTMREGALIVDELRRGSADALLQMFPWLVDHILAKHLPNAPAAVGNSGDGSLLKEVQELRQLLTTKILGEHAPNGLLMAAHQQASPGNARQLDAPKFDMPRFDDDDDDLLDGLIKVDTNAGKTAAENFLRSIANL